MTFAVWQNAHRNAMQASETEFHFWVDKIADTIEYRLNGCVQVLQGVTGLFDASIAVTRQEFHQYVQALSPKKYYSSIQGIGFSAFIPAAQKAAHEAAIRQEGFVDYAIRPAGARDFYTPVIYIEPFSGHNLRAFGDDMSPEPVRWTAATRARDTGQAALSGKVMLQQKTTMDSQPGFVLFMPVYRPNPPTDTPEARRASLVGWVFASLQMRDFMHSVLRAVEFDESRQALNIEVYDGVYLAPEAQLFAMESAPQIKTSNLAFQTMRRFQFGGHPWSLQVTSIPPFAPGLNIEKTTLIALTGSIGSLLLALLVGSLTFSHRCIAAALEETARNLAEREKVEQALRESEARLRSYFELPLIGIAITSLDKGWLETNDRVCEILGYSRKALQQKTWAELTHPSDLAADITQFNRVIAGEIDSYSLEKRFVRANGQAIPTALSVACVRAADARPKYFVALIQDITERKQAEEELRITLHHLNALLASLYAGVLLVSDEGRIEFANQAFCDLFDLKETPDRLRGLTGEEMLRKIEAFHASPIEARMRIQEIVAQSQPVKGEELLMRDGRLYVRDYVPIFINGQRYGRLWQHVDITQRKQVEEALRASLTQIQRHANEMTTLNRMNDLLLSCANFREAYAVIACGAKKLFAPYNGGLAVCQDDALELQVVVSWGASPSLCANFSRDDCWALQRGELHIVTDPAHDLRCRHFRGAPGNAYLCVPLITQEQTLGLLQVSAPEGLPNPAFEDLCILTTTVSESIKLTLSNLRLRAALREQAVRDPLTGLFNRRYLDETLPRELHHCQRSDEPLTVAMLDLDHFKQFNDAYGHEAGDTVLRAMGELLRSSLRGGDIACRYGGEELTIILPGAALTQAQIRLDHLRRAVMDLHLPYRWGELPAITVSIGVVEAQPGEADAGALLSRADAALYQAKAAGRNRVAVA